MSLLDVLDKYVWTGVPAGAAWDVVKLSWRKISQQSWEQLYLQAFKAAISEYQPHLQKKYCSVDITWNDQALTQVLHQDIGLRLSTLSPSELERQEFIETFAQALETRAFIVIGNKNLGRKDYQQLIRNVIRLANTHFETAIRNDETAFREAVQKELAERPDYASEVIAWLQQNNIKHLLVIQRTGEKTYQKVDNIERIGKETYQEVQKIRQSLNRDVTPRTPPDLRSHEQAYLHRIKERYAEDAPYYIPLAGETTEVDPAAPVPTPAPRSARRRRQRAGAEYCEWIQAGQEIKRIKLKTLRAGVDKYPCVILLGDPGSGKTTALEHLAYEFADKSDTLPLSLRLSEFGPGMTVESFIEQVWGGSLDAGHWGKPELAANLTSYLETGRLFILFDALNEMPRTGYSERAQALRRFIDHWSKPGNRFLVTCRVLDYGEELSGLQRVEVQPLNEAQIQTFLQKELPANWQSLWQELTQGSDNQHRLLDMAHNPYLLTIMVDIYAEDGQLGHSRAELMQRFTQILMTWAKAKVPPADWLEAEAQREALAVTAFEMQKRAGSGTVVETQRVKRVIPQQVQLDPDWPPEPTPPEQVLSLAASANIIEMPVDRSSVRFYHQLLQEYFAAQELLNRDPNSLANLWRWPWLERDMPAVGKRGYSDPLPPPPPTGWEETTILAAELALENDEQLVQALVQINPVLAGRCLHERRARVDKATRQAVIEALLVTINRPEVALRVRIAAGEVLGFLGDPRLGQLVTIPRGEFVMGGDKDWDGKPQHWLYLPEYRISQYLLTNAEYTHFIEAGGYQTRRWWTEAGWQKKKSDNWTEPSYWNDSLFDNPNQPVVGISWYESVAYCRWLRAETGLFYRLPTEAEWEKAARGTDGRIYPWGNDFDPARVNMNKGDQWVNTTTPVGIYPTGKSPFEVYDCAGNVWEWCATKQEKSYPYDITEYEWTEPYLKGTSVRVLRGASWKLSSVNSARCAVRLDYNPYYRDLRRGCRVAVSSLMVRRS